MTAVSIPQQIVLTDTKRRSKRHAEFDIEVSFGEMPFRIESDPKYASFDTALGSSMEMLESLDEAEYFLLKPIPIVIEQIDNDDFVALFEEANVSASGESLEESREMLKDMLVGQLIHLESIAPQKLSAGLRNKLSLLRAHIGKR